jgi:serine phosphatase RsbU (regulator of sigma subunit)
MAVLRELSGDREYHLRPVMTVIGRDSACDIVINTGMASRRHAIIVNSGGDYAIEDLDSLNGTFINGRRIHERTRLEGDEQIDIAGLSVIFQGDKPRPGAVTPDESTLLGKPSADRSPSILSSLDAVTDLRVQVKPEVKLRALLEISKNLSGTFNLKEVLPKILESLFNIFPQADRGFILINDPDTGKLIPRAQRSRHKQEKDAPSFSRTVIDHAMRTGQAVLSADAATDQRFEPSQSIRILQIRSIMCVPMIGSEGARLGVIQLDSQDLRNQFHQEDLDVLATAATQAARAVEFVCWHEERRDLEAAIQIQKSFLPNECPSVNGLEFFDFYSPAQHIGGDYYDYVPLPGNRLAVAVGDVSGKGIAAALLMARLSSAVRFCLATAPSVSEAVRQLSKLLTRSGTEDRFITFVVVVLDLDRFTMTLVNAGHLPPLRRRAGRTEAEVLGEAIVGLPLAVMDRPYEEMMMPLEPGDTLMLFTDGVTEAKNVAGDFYGLERLTATVRAAPPDVQSLGTAILTGVQNFAAGRRPSDDLAIVCFGRGR